MTLSLKTHHTRTRNGTRSLVRTTHYVRLGMDGFPPIYLQDGEAYSEGGEVYEDLDQAYLDEIDKLTPQARKSVGWETDADIKELENPKPKAKERRISARRMRSNQAPAEEVRDTSADADTSATMQAGTIKGKTGEGPTVDDVLKAADEAGQKDQLAEDLNNEAEGREAADTGGGEASSGGITSTRPKKK